MNEFFAFLAIVWFGMLGWFAFDKPRKYQWVSIEDGMPDEDVDVLVTDGADMWVMSYSNQDDDGSYYYMWEDKSGQTAEICDMTHWMELPERPKNKYDIS